MEDPKVGNLTIEDPKTMPDTHENGIYRDDPDDALTIIEADDATSDVNSDSEIEATFRQMVVKLDKMDQTLDIVASRSDSKISSQLGELLELLKLQGKLPAASAASATPMMPGVTSTSEENRSVILSSTIGQLQVELAEEVGRLKRELAQKSKENKMLHGVVQQAQSVPDVTDDEIERQFRDMRNEIERFSREHFHQFDPRVSVGRHMKSSSHPLWVESFVADRLFNYIFKRRLFGHTYPFEDVLAEFEHCVAEENASDADIRAWVAATIKLTSRRSPLDGREFSEKVPNSILRSLDECIEFSDGETLFNDMLMLCQNAYRIALIIRKSRTMYQWHQSQPASRGLDESHFTTLRGYDEIDGRGQCKPFRIRFGPVFKIGNGESVCIRKGELLVPTNS